MTTDELIALSKRVAEKLGIEPDVQKYVGEHPEIGSICDSLWLHEDSARCFDFLGEHDMQLTHYHGFKYVDAPTSLVNNFREYYKDHNNDRNLAARVAILKVLEAM